MAVTYTTALKNTRMTDVLTAIDIEASAGKLEIGTAAMATTLVTFTLADPSGTVAAGVLTLDFDPDISAVAAATGTAAAARIRTGADADVVTGLTVGTSGTDIILDSTSITSGQTVTIQTGTITHG